MVEINTVVILLTPHHKRSISLLFPQIFKSQKTLLLYSPVIRVDEFECQKYLLTDYAFSRRRIFSSPLQFVKPFRDNIQKIDKEIKALELKYCFQYGIQWFFGSDKDIFTQLLLQRLNSKLGKVIAIDEGLGFYLFLSYKDRLISFLYWLMTPILFGRRLYYVKRLGTIRAIDTVYLRHKELLPRTKKGVDYREFSLKSKQNHRNIVKGKVLFFSYAEQDFMLDPKKKIETHRELAALLRETGRELIIKPHPREDSGFLREGLKNESNLTILESNQMGEDLDYFAHELIINVFSSLIFDLLDSNYPKNRIITLGFLPKPPMKFDGKMTYIPLKNFNVKTHLHLEP
ncbi:polysialyltransferase family glycosyltransferase [Flagellimonas sp. 2504JD1-5]